MITTILLLAQVVVAIPASPPPPPRENPVYVQSLRSCPIDHPKTKAEKWHNAAITVQAGTMTPNQWHSFLQQCNQLKYQQQVLEEMRKIADKK